MKAITVDESKKIQLEILKEIREICEANDIRYYLAYGSLLGAVRHKGFIPWDDDIDIVMPRPDYLDFLKIAKSKRFDLIAFENNDDYIYSFAKASDKNTLITMEGIRCKTEIGVSVDIFPIDGAGQTVEEAQNSFGSTTVLYGLAIATTWKKYIPGRSKNKKRNLMRYGSFIISRFVNRRAVLKKFNEAVIRKEYESNEYVAVYSSPYRTKEIMEREIYGEPSKVSFEGELFDAPSDCDKYLTNIYGDYMKLPPEDQRVPLHTTNIYLRGNI